MDVGGRDPYCHGLALVIDHQMELEPKEPTHGTAAPLGHSSEHLVLSAPCVMTNRQLGAIHKVDAAPLTSKPVHQQVRRQEEAGHQGHKAFVTGQLVAVGAILLLQPIEPEGLERLVRRGVEKHHDEQHSSISARERMPARRC